MSTTRDPSGAHRYGTHHKRIRAGFARRMRTGELFYCWRCGKEIDPAKWDLGHVDAEHRASFGSRWPECRPCNRATLPRMLAEARAVGGYAAPRAEHDCRQAFDPKACPQCRENDPEPANMVTCWSIHWPGAGGDVFNPRCRDCRARGSACDVALARQAAA